MTLPEQPQKWIADFGFFFPFKIGMFPFETECLGECGVPRTPKPAEIPLKQGKSNETTTGLITGIGIKLGQELS